MADRHFVEERQLAEEHEVVEVEIVPGVDAEAERVRQPRRLGVLRERRARAALGAALERARERLRVELDAVGADRRRPANRIRRRVDEEADADPRDRAAADRRPAAARVAGPGRQPAWLVTSPGTTGTSVHWSGRTSSTRSSSSGARIAFDVELDAGRVLAQTSAIARTSSGVMCRRSARGWTVMPGAPAATQTSTASSTLGTRPPRELRSVATLLTLTHNRTMHRHLQLHGYRSSDTCTDRFGIHVTRCTSIEPDDHMTS